MNKSLPSAILSLLWLAGNAFCASLSTTAESPQDANINQSAMFESDSISDGIQARYVSDGENRSLTQTFVWNSSGKLTSIGIRVSPDQGQYFKFGRPQKYGLDVQLLSNDSTRVLQTLESATFTLTPQEAAAGHYFVITFDQPLTMEKKQLYGFHLYPVEITGNRLIIATTGDGKGDSFPDGAGNQHGAPGAIPEGKAYGKARQNFDLVFFTTATH